MSGGRGAARGRSAWRDPRPTAPGQSRHGAGRARDLVPGRLERDEAPEERHGAPLDVVGVADEPQPGEAAEERLERDLGLEPRERRAEAVVAAAAERDVLVVGAARRRGASGSAKRAGSRSAAPRIAITSSPRRIVCPPSSTSAAAQRLSVRSTGCLVAEHLLDAPAGIAAGSERSRLELTSGSRSSATHGVADQADRRLVAGDDQEHDRAEELLLAERVARLVRRSSALTRSSLPARPGGRRRARGR